MNGAIEAAASALLGYSSLLLPGLALLTACFWWSRADRDPMMRIMVLILGFVLIRDAMTPAKLWEFGLANGAPWLRMTTNSLVLVVFGVGSLLLVGITLLDRQLRQLVMWGKPTFVTVSLGVFGGILAAAPVLLLSAGSPLSVRGGSVALSVLPALAFMSFAGNLGEEVFFRGYLQGRLEPAIGKIRAALLSAFTFAACHTFLATTVTDVGWPLLAFTLWEGLICAFLRLRWGVIPAAIAHGLAIFLLSSGLA